MLTPIERLRLLSKVFTRPVFANLGRTGDWRVALSFLDKYDLLKPSDACPLTSVFETAWRELRASYRNEYVYKNEIANRIIFGLHSPRTASLHVELPVGRSIVDIAVYNGTSTAYEIKTEFDSARRLETQTRDYLKAFEKVYVVAHPDFAQSFANLVSSEVGVLSLCRRGHLSKVKPASPNSQKLDSETMFRCLRRDEYVSGLQAKTSRSLSLPNGVIRRRCQEIFHDLAIPNAHSLYLQALRSRNTNPVTVNFVSGLPPSLRALGYGTPLSSRQRDMVSSALQSDVCIALA